MNTLRKRSQIKSNNPLESKYFSEFVIGSWTFLLARCSIPRSSLCVGAWSSFPFSKHCNMNFLYSSSVGPTNSHSGPKWQSSILALEFATKLDIKVVRQKLQLSVELFVLHNGIYYYIEGRNWKGNGTLNTNKYQLKVTSLGTSSNKA